ncbi:MAG TPA: BsuBI/PstI family type II restriction endonuclease [bacterium]|nr:BsuBI/PstI family type II restriction endonuclease [bacterium]HQM83173.1 BsuBI/PstI family type II restriction endonuclease [bacterium]
MTTKKQRIEEAVTVLKEIGMPKEQINERTGLCLLALLDLTSNKNWSDVSNPRLTIRDILDFARYKFDVKYAENTRESVRKYSVKQLVAAGILVHNPDKPDRPVNSSANCYQVTEPALVLFRKFGSKAWKTALKEFLTKQGTLAAQYKKDRDLRKIPLRIKEGVEIAISPGKHSELIRSVIEDFGPCFVPGGELVYVGDTGKKWGYFDEKLLSSIGVKVEEHGKMPDVVIYYRKKNWLVLVEAVSSSGPVDGIRHDELSKLFKKSTAGLVYVTAFPDRGETFRKFLSVVAWETEVWCASDPTHLIHFNGTKFLGPY